MADKFNDELKFITGGKSDVGTPQFPGMQKGYSIEQIRSLIKKQKRWKGFRLNIATGTNNFDLQLSGTARIFLGFIFLPPDFSDPTGTPESMTFKINEEVVIDTVRPFIFTNYVMDDEFYFLPRPLSGTDQLKLTIQNAGGAQSWDMAIAYI